MWNYDFEDINIVNEEIELNKIIAYADVVVSNSFDADGKYHKYLYDTYKTYVTAATFGDYSGSSDIETIAHLANSATYNVFINELKNTSNSYNIFEKICVNEIEEERSRRNTAYYLNDVLKSTKKVVEAINGIIGSIDKDAIKNLDINELVNMFLPQTENNNMMEDDLK